MTCLSVEGHLETYCNSRNTRAPDGMYDQGDANDDDWR
jgi:hypothetical protein